MASTIKVDNVQNQPGTNIVNKCGTTITLGACGDTVSLASGASQTGFGRTGTVDWDTSIHTGTVTAATGKGYFVNTTSGGITVNLPAAAVGSIVAVSDYASTSDSNTITVTPNGSEKINGVNDDYRIQTAGLAVTLVYADATKGWKSVTGSDADATGVAPAYVAATGGTPCAGTTCGDYKIHSFTGPGTLCVSAAGNCAGNNKIDFLVVAGGAGGGWDRAGGGGAGGYRESKQPGAPWTASPIVATPVSGTNGITASVQGYPIAIGGGGAGGTSPAPLRRGTAGVDSTFSTITSTGGGGGGSAPSCFPGGNGGSGGGASSSPPAQTGGSGNTPPVSPAQGFDGGGTCVGPEPSTPGAGGGGATTVGVSASNPAGRPFNGAILQVGGTGATTCISGSPTAYSGGGGGAASGDSPETDGPGGAGGTGGGGAGGASPGGNVGTAGTVNTGGGGGGGGNSGQADGGAGGSGIVIIRYKFQN